MLIAVSKQIGYKVTRLPLSLYYTLSRLFSPIFLDIIGYYKGHSTETTFFSITHTILYTLNSNTCFQLILLELSSAFDTLEHNILISRLTLMGISVLVLKWLTNLTRLFLHLTTVFPKDLF